MPDVTPPIKSSSTRRSQRPATTRHSSRQATIEHHILVLLIGVAVGIAATLFLDARIVTGHNDASRASVTADVETVPKR